MADPGSLDSIIKVAGGGVGGAALAYMAMQVFGGFLKGWVSGAPGQEKELRSDMAQEIKELRQELRDTRDEVDELREDIKRLTRMYLHVLITRTEARAALNALEKINNLPPTVFADDPPELLNPPPPPRGTP
ncbi:hypothetical protein [Deinococcus ruber]|uniref:Uncharacterized protein n=1 Tax=Deinococcus ruber TaxID=1848197 RepID=A0A918C838_9DEIO|nr:hypothetical protein [Deinococcus ruber]GGR11313.1 hypothetical protein GCM10008957_25050 [Deinococcus ruber]